MKTRMQDGSGHRSYRYLFEDVDRHGNTRVYYRRKGQPKIRMRAIPGTPEFDHEYQLVFQGAMPAAGTKKALPGYGSFPWLCRQYYESAPFQKLDPSTRRHRRSALDDCSEAIGDLRFSLIEPRHVAKLRDEKAANPGAANHRVQALRALFKWATSPEYDYAKVNPAERVAYLPPINREGFKPWTEDDAAKYEARHPIGTKARLAFDLLLYTGVRVSDLIRLGPQMVPATGAQAGKLVFSEFKGRNRIAKHHALDILAPLRASIDATTTGHLIFIATPRGTAYSSRTFGEWFKTRCGEAGIDPKLSAHGVRKLSATLCADNGATEQQLNSLYGWTSAKQSSIYTRNANRTKLAADASALLARR